MTMPFERTQAVLRARAFLRKLQDAQRTPKVPRAIRQEALALLRHYPDEDDIARIAQLATLWLARPEQTKP